MRPDGEVVAGEVGEVGRGERGLTLGRTQRTASHDDGIASVRAFRWHLPWEAETVAVAGRSSGSVTEIE